MRAAKTAGGKGRAAPPEVTGLRRRIEGLEALPVPELKALWSEVWGSPSPKGARRRLLMLGIAWRWQTEARGGFRPETARRLAALEKGARRDAGIGPTDVAEAARPRPGARLLRDWRGVRHEVHVTHTGYLWQGRSFGSLSSVAKAITGAHRNGPAFFGLRSGGEVR